MFVVERYSHFLIIEWKGIDEPLTQGQRILLANLSGQQRWTVVVLYGNGREGQPEFLRRVEHGELLGIEETSRKDFQRRLDDWYRKANGIVREREEATA